MKREYYAASIDDFLSDAPEYILGQLLINNEFETTDLQKNAWRREIEILREQLCDFTDGEVAFEYTIPRIGHRIDVVCIIRGIIFLLEFKVGDKAYKKATDDQVVDYALDLKYFHESSQNRYIVPISVSTEAPNAENHICFTEDHIAEALHSNRKTITSTIAAILGTVSDSPLSMTTWSNSRYAPTPTIIEAAQALYRNHSVDDISRNDAGAQNLTETTAAISRIIDDCKSNGRKAICFVTGVPGAGKRWLV